MKEPDGTSVLIFFGCTGRASARGPAAHEKDTALNHRVSLLLDFSGSGRHYIAAFAANKKHPLPRNAKSRRLAPFFG